MYNDVDVKGERCRVHYRIGGINFLFPQLIFKLLTSFWFDCMNRVQDERLEQEEERVAQNPRSPVVPQ